MMTARFLSSLILVIAVSASCGSDDEGTPLSETLQELNDGISSVEQLAVAHGATVEAAGSLGEMSLEESAYATNVEGVHEDLHHAMEDMGMCGHGDEMLDLTELDEAVEALEAELSAHTTAMGAAADTTAALAEEERHQTQVASLVMELHTHHETAATDGVDFTCGRDSH